MATWLAFRWYLRPCSRSLPYELPKNMLFIVKLCNRASNADIFQRSILFHFKSSPTNLRIFFGLLSFTLTRGCQFKLFFLKQINCSVIMLYPLLFLQSVASYFRLTVSIDFCLWLFIISCSHNIIFFPMIPIGFFLPVLLLTESIEALKSHF